LDKVCPNIDAALADIPDGASIAIGGFFSAGTPAPLIKALARQGAKDLTLICMQIGPGNEDIEELARQKRVKKAISSYPFYRSATKGAQSTFEQAVRAGEIQVRVYPMGTFAEKLRAAAVGLAAFYTPSGVGTVVEAGKERRRFGDKDYLLEVALKPDYAFVYAHRGDPMGNLVCHKTARNFNPEMAAAATITIAAVEDIVETGTLDPDQIHIPGIYVDRVVRVDRPKYHPSIG
jgi:3-oxoacid CoA-transferase A subunit